MAFGAHAAPISNAQEDSSVVEVNKLSHSIIHLPNNPTLPNLSQTNLLENNIQLLFNPSDISNLY